MGRGNARVPFERSREMALIAIAHGSRDLAQRSFCVGQIPPRSFNSQFADIISKSAMVVAAKGTAEMGRVNVCRLRDCLEGQIFRAPFVQQIFHVFQPNRRLQLHRAAWLPARRREHFQCQALDCQG